MPTVLRVAGIARSICVRLSLIFLASLAAHAEGDKLIVLVADSRRFSGGMAWWTNLYNESHLAFALLTITIIPALALVMGKLADFLLSRIGINLKSRVLAEH